MENHRNRGLPSSLLREPRAELEAGQHERRMAVIMETAALEGVTGNIVQSMGVLTPPQT